MLTYKDLRSETRQFDDIKVGKYSLSRNQELQTIGEYFYTHGLYIKGVPESYLYISDNSITKEVCYSGKHYYGHTTNLLEAIEKEINGCLASHEKKLLEIQDMVNRTRMVLNAK
jgi:hypothetical protein